MCSFTLKDCNNDLFTTSCKHFLSRVHSKVHLQITHWENDILNSLHAGTGTVYRVSLQCEFSHEPSDNMTARMANFTVCTVQIMGFSPV
jgi:hypothetical protein